MENLETGRKYEEIRAQFANNVLDVMKEEGLNHHIVATRIGISRRALRRWIWTKDLSFSNMVTLIHALGGVYRPFIMVASWPPKVQKPRSRNLLDKLLHTKGDQNG